MLDCSLQYIWSVSSIVLFTLLLRITSNVMDLVEMKTLGDIKAAYSFALVGFNEFEK